MVEPSALSRRILGEAIESIFKMPAKPEIWKAVMSDQGLQWVIRNKDEVRAGLRRLHKLPCLLYSNKGAIYIEEKEDAV